MYRVLHFKPSARKAKGSRRLRALLVSILSLILCCMSVQTAVSVDRTTLENEVKAAYIYNFVKFVDWPAGTFRSSNTPIIIAVAGDDEFGALLGTIVKNKTIQEHPVIVNLVKKPADFRNCQLIFISAAELKKSRKALDELQGSPIITVTETDPGSPLKGVINIFMEGDRLQFEINTERAEKSHLQFSSKLLRLSRGAMAGRMGKGE